MVVAVFKAKVTGMVTSSLPILIVSVPETELGSQRVYWLELGILAKTLAIKSGLQSIVAVESLSKVPNTTASPKGFPSTSTGQALMVHESFVAGVVVEPVDVVEGEVAAGVLELVLVAGAAGVAGLVGAVAEPGELVDGDSAEHAGLEATGELEVAPVAGAGELAVPVEMAGEVVVVELSLVDDADPAGVGVVLGVSGALASVAELELVVELGLTVVAGVVVLSELAADVVTNGLVVSVVLAVSVFVVTGSTVSDVVEDPEAVVESALAIVGTSSRDALLRAMAIARSLYFTFLAK